MFSLLSIALNIGDMFGKLYVLGATVWVVGQAFINIAAISGIIPLTGVPLPFISYGGTSLIAILAALGIVANISERG